MSEAMAPKWQRARVLKNELYPEDSGRLLWVKIGSRATRPIYEMKTKRDIDADTLITNLSNPNRDNIGSTIMYASELLELRAEFAEDVPVETIDEWLAHPPQQRPHA